MYAIRSYYEEHLFEKFYSDNTLDNNTGTGIGLYLTKTLIDRHNGIIEVDSQAGKGTTFRNNFVQHTLYEVIRVGRGDSNLPGRNILLNTRVKDRILLCCGEHGLWETTDPGNYPDKSAVAVKQLEGQCNKDGAHSVADVVVNP